MLQVGEGTVPDDNRIVVAVAGHLLVHDKGPLEGEPVQRWFPLVNKITSTTGNNKTQIRWDIIFNHWTDSTVRYSVESKKKKRNFESESARYVTFTALRTWNRDFYDLGLDLTPKVIKLFQLILNWIQIWFVLKSKIKIIIPVPKILKKSLENDCRQEVKSSCWVIYLVFAYIVWKASDCVQATLLQIFVL